MLGLSFQKRQVELVENKDYVFVEVVANEDGYSSITPSPMSHYQFLKEFKLSNCIICTSNSLSSFFAPDTNPDMGFHDHRDIISAIAY